MALPQPTAVAAAFAGGVPTDVREWIVVDIVGSPSAYRRGYAVLVEPLQDDGRGHELAMQVRDVLLHELRLHAKQAPDAALVHAFGVANSLLFEDARHNPGAARQIGATAIIFQDHDAIIAHVPPGQVVLVQDHLVYSVPDLDSHLPHWAIGNDANPPTEPLGFANWIAPVLVQTELLPGDTIVLCDAATSVAVAGVQQASPLRRYFARNPDEILDDIRNLALDADQPFGAIAVISFPPNPITSEIESIADVGRNAREQARHARATMRAVVPSVPQLRREQTEPGSGIVEVAEPEQPAPAIPKLSFQERLLRITEGRPTEGGGTWQPRSPEAQFGAPGAHGVRRHKRVTGLRDGVTWKSGVPRAPFLSSPVFIGIVLVAVFLLGALIWSQRDIFLPDATVYEPILAQVDQRLHAANALTTESDILAELDAAQKDLTRADGLGAPSDEVADRQMEITLKRDEVTGTYRVSNVTRIGSLPTELQNGGTSAFWTAGGIFLANGDLYRLNPTTAEIQKMLVQGNEIEGIRIGHLFAVTYDGTYLTVTDGKAVFFASSTDGAIWQAMTLDDINNQGAWPESQIASFGESMYMLVPEYRNIYEFPLDANQQIVAPYDWVSVGDRVNLNIATDFAIDGNIYTLLEDGRVVTYRGGLEVGRFDVPGFDAENDKAVALVNGAATGYLYIAVVDGNGHGRVIATDKQGQHAVIMELPIDFTNEYDNTKDPFAGLQDMVVDENTGQLYLINADAVWSFSYTLPPLTDSSATPEVDTTGE